ncbi:MAG: response regulator [Bacteroidota bacterium]|jgi:DNA-binding NarL/FixJ family response regulator|nr:response regulator transcription factor [Bacteroidota bacterium]GDX47277.1 DNA-binding response regulator [Bacteroidota bacterium]
MPIQVYIADDHHLFIAGVKALLSEVPELELAGDAENGRALLDLLTLKKVDVILMDINMPVMSGVETTKKIKELYPEIKILALTMFDDTLHINEMINAGASGYLLKNAGKEELVTAIKKVYAGEKYVSNEVSVKLIERMFNKEQEKTSTVASNTRKSELTKREIEIIKLIAQEMTNAEIAAKLNNSPMTIITHRKNLLRKLGVKNTAGLIKYAMQNGLVE